MRRAESPPCSADPLGADHKSDQFIFPDFTVDRGITTKIKADKITIITANLNSSRARLYAYIPFAKSLEKGPTAMPEEATILDRASM